MKKTLFLMLLFNYSVIFSQKEFKEWAPLGAYWLYWTPNFSSFHECVYIAHDRDTLINNHKYKVFDVYDLLVVNIPTTGGRREKFLFSYHIGIVGDTVFTYCRGQKKERYYIDKDIIGEKIYLFRDCNPLDTVWKRLDTVYYGTIGGTANGLKFKYRVYSSNAEFYPTYIKGDSIPKKNLKDTIVEFLPFKTGTFSYHYGDNWAFHKEIKYSQSTNCYCSGLYTDSNSSYYPEKFECYFDSNFGSYSFWGNQCWLRYAYMAIHESVKKTFSVYPNPTNHSLSISIEHIGELDYILYDISGKYILSNKLPNNKIVDVSELPKGNYYISLQIKSEAIGVKQFIKN